jgi:hypothetical protein
LSSTTLQPERPHRSGEPESNTGYGTPIPGPSGAA